ncbi:MAG: chromate transporter [Anaeromyxobacteraceae bacterium]
MRDVPAAAGSEALERPSSPVELFVAFTLLALQGFGGVVVVAQRVLCEDRRWVTRDEFLELLSIGQVLPGPNICNVALMLGDRFFGWRGAVAALGGLLAVPFAIVLSLVAVYAHWSGNPAVAGALRGMGAVSAGLIVGTAAKLARSLRASPLGVPACVVIGAAAFLLVGVLRLPLAWALLAVGGAAYLLAWRRVGGGEGPP